MTPKKRFAFIDQYRGWAVLFMIETHVTNAFLRLDLLTAIGFKIADFINGLVAPSFLFLAGFSFGINAIKKWDDFLLLKTPFWQQVRRYLFIWMIAYTLRIPGYSFKVLVNKIKWMENNLFWGVDILHCIAASLMICLLLVLILRKQQRFFIFLGVAAVVIFLVTPFVHASSFFNGFPGPFKGYFVRIKWSMFPLFHWAGYLFSGAVCSYLWQLYKSKDAEFFFFSRLTRICAVVLAVTFPFVFIKTSSIPGHIPHYFMKLALVGLLLSFFYFWEQKNRSFPGIVTVAGQESLLGYTSHIYLIYGPFAFWANTSIASYIGKTCSPWSIVLMTIILLVLTLLMCLGWHKLKEKNLKLSKTINFIFWIVAFTLLTVFKL